MAHSTTEDYIFSYLVSKGLSAAGACGAMANIYFESGFISKNLQNNYEKSLGYTDETYTKSVDNGTYTNFEGDSAGYGLCQWTYSTRKANLLKFTRDRGKSIGDLATQLDFLLLELSGYPELLTLLKTAPNTSTGAYEAGRVFCKSFERPLVDSSVYRGNYAATNYADYFGGDGTAPIILVESVGSKIVEIATAQIGKPYKWGAEGPDSFDCSGFVYYCLNQAEYKISRMSAGSYLSYFLSQGKSYIKIDDARDGDLLFWGTSANEATDQHIAIATSDGGMIEATAFGGKVRKMDDRSHFGRIADYAIRFLSESESGVYQYSSATSSSSEEIAVGTGEYNTISSLNPYTSIIEENIASVQSEGYDFGYLIDMDHGGSFKFYIPEFTEDAGANWSTIDIRGRSVDVLAYDNTSSRKITISLDLYAGAGVYKTTEGTTAGLASITKMHQDLNFVKSLEYPDYTTAITIPPATVQLILGSAISLVGVVSSVSVQHLKPLDSQNRSMYTKLTFTVTQTATNPPDWKDIRKGLSSITSDTDVNSMDDGTENKVIDNTQK